MFLNQRFEKSFGNETPRLLAGRYSNSANFLFSITRSLTSTLHGSELDSREAHITTSTKTASLK